MGYKMGRKFLPALLLLFLVPCAFADGIGPLELFLLPGILIAVPFINYFLNFAVLFATQKLFLKSFFSSIPLKRVLVTVVWVTVAGWVLDWAAALFLGAFAQVSLWPYFLTAFIFLFAGQSVLLAGLKFGSKRDAHVLALALAVFTNPSWVLLVAPFTSPVLWMAAALVILVAVFGFALMVFQALKGYASKKEVLQNKALVFKLLLLAAYCLLCTSVLFGFPRLFYHAPNIIPPECSAECASLTTPVLSTDPPSTDICTGHVPASNPDCTSACTWSGTTCYYEP